MALPALVVLASPARPAGVHEAVKAGTALKQHDFQFDIAYTSVLTRAIKTLWVTLEKTDQAWIPVVRDWRLNERHYGGLTGLNKAETATKHGEEQVMLWRRSYDIPPPPQSTSDPYWPGKDRRYKDIPKELLPVTESLKTTGDRCWGGTVPSCMPPPPLLPHGHGCPVPCVRCPARGGECHHLGAILTMWLRCAWCVAWLRPGFARVQGPAPVEHGHRAPDQEW